MSRLMIAAVLSVAAFSIGCPSQTAICKSGVDQVCERVFECQSDAAKATPQFQAVFGTSIDDCKTKIYANPLGPQQKQGIACDDVDTDQQLCTNLGQPDATSFDLGKASDCKDARANLSCADYLAQLSDPTKAPAACNERCK